jgi:hypothetical protein
MGKSNVTISAEGQGNYSRPRHTPGHWVINALATILSLFGVLILILSVQGRSVEKAGAQVDAWISMAAATLEGITQKIKPTA